MTPRVRRRTVRRTSSLPHFKKRRVVQRENQTAQHALVFVNKRVILMVLSRVPSPQKEYRGSFCNQHCKEPDVKGDKFNSLATNYRSLHDLSRMVVTPHCQTRTQSSTCGVRLGRDVVHLDVHGTFDLLTAALLVTNSGRSSLVNAQTEHGATLLALD